jgi:hypothetical protein
MHSLALPSHLPSHHGGQVDTDFSTYLRPGTLAYPLGREPAKIAIPTGRISQSGAQLEIWRLGTVAKKGGGRSISYKKLFAEHQLR